MSSATFPSPDDPGSNASLARFIEATLRLWGIDARVRAGDAGPTGRSHDIVIGPVAAGPRDDRTDLAPDWAPDFVRGRCLRVVREAGNPTIPKGLPGGPAVAVEPWRIVAFDAAAIDTGAVAGSSIPGRVQEASGVTGVAPPIEARSLRVLLRELRRQLDPGYVPTRAIIGVRAPEAESR